jgi:hypothetical protein
VRIQWADFTLNSSYEEGPMPLKTCSQDLSTRHKALAGGGA